MGTRKVYFEVKQDVYDRVRAAADADRRSVSNWLAFTIERAVEDKPQAGAEQPAP